MSAGKGLYHSEHNLNATTPCRFIQTWLRPRKLNGDINYSSAKFKDEDRYNKFLHIIKDVWNKESDVKNSIN
jgi:redox-sensitive bicupin YhaK (pirin superfamily)